MVQTLLIFVLGFLAAALFALMIAPAVWRRAVFLTRKRIESALPLTANELNAEKDKLRAEHAMAIRRIEMRAAKLLERDTKQKVNLANQATQIRGLEENLAESLATGAKLENEVQQLSGQLHDTTTELSETAIALESTKTELGLRTDEMKKASRQVEMLAAKLDGAKIDLATRDAQIDSLTESLNEVKAARKELQRENRALQAEAKATGEMLATERKRLVSVEAKLEKSIAKISDLEERIDRREKELVRARENTAVGEAEFHEMEGRAIAAEKERAALESEVGEINLRINRLMAIFGDNDPEVLVKELRARLAQQAAALEKLENERDTLNSELDAAKAVARDRGADGSGDAVLREKLNELAAEVVAMAARLEGPQSRINTLLADDKAAPVTDVVSLADRIKALQRSANSQRSVSS